MFIARDGGEAVGFATLDWKWSSPKGARIGYLEDLYVTPETRGRGDRRRADRGVRGALPGTRRAGNGVANGPDNHRAQAVYDRTGAAAETFIEYELGL